MSLTQEQLNDLGSAYHRADVVACPLCHSRLEVAEHRYAPRVSVPVRFICPVHGVLGESEPTELRIAWTDEQTKQMLAEYLRRSEARCPEDKAQVSVVYVRNEAGAYVHFGCPTCGRMWDGSPPDV